jgi:hypothetical protein
MVNVLRLPGRGCPATNGAPTAADSQNPRERSTSAVAVSGVWSVVLQVWSIGATIDCFVRPFSPEKSRTLGMDAPV